MKTEQPVFEFRSFIHELTYLLNATYVEVPASIVQAMGGTLSRRVVCTINGKVTFQIGFMALREGAAYITVNAQRLKKLGVKPGDEVHVSLVNDESEYGVPMPDELEALLQQDDEGARRFSLLSKGMQRYILNYVSSVKNPQKRIDRALLLVGNLKQLKEGKETFREMLGKGPRQI